MRNLVILLLLVIAGFALNALYGHSRPAAPAITPATATAALALAPEVTFTALDGSTFTLSSLRGKTVLLNFWASWCAPCRVEFPQFIALARQRPDVVILALSVDHNRATLDKFIEELGPELRQANILLAHDPGKVIAQDVFQTLRYPETVRIDPQGHMVRKYVGLEVKWDSPEFIATLP